MKNIIKIILVFAIFISILGVVEKFLNGSIKNLIFEKKSNTTISLLPECPSDYMKLLALGRNNCFSSFEFYDGSENFVGEYIGEWKNNKRHGKGSMIYANGDKYSGEWKNNKRHGKGSIIYSNGDRYIGLGSMIFNNGSKYIGEWKNNKRHGNGSIIFSNGDKYIGKWKNGRNNGYGVKNYANGKKTSLYYINNRLVSNICSSIVLSNDYNELRKCMYQLISSSKLVNLSRFPICEFNLQDQDNCFAFIINDNNAYLGEVKNYQVNGEGIYFDLKSGDSYIGNFRNNQMNGKFLIKSPEGIVRKDFLNNGMSIYESCLIARTLQITAECSRAESANDNDYVKKYCQRKDFKDFWYRECVQGNIDEVNSRNANF